MVLDAKITVFDFLVERKSVLKTRTPAAGDEDTQFQVWVCFLTDELAHLACRGIGENQHIGCGRGHIGDADRFGSRVHVVILLGAPWPIKVMNRLWDLRSPPRLPNRPTRGPFRPMNQFPIYLGAHGSFK